MQKVIRIKLLKDPGAAGGFCMSVGSIIELYNGGFRSPEVNASYYPVFGPYMLIERVAHEIINGTAKPEAKELFEVVDCTDTITPTTLHEIFDEAGGLLVCTINHKSLMKLLKDNLVTRVRLSETKDKFRVSNTLFLEDVIAHTIEATV